MLLLKENWQEWLCHAALRSISCAKRAFSSSPTLETSAPSSCSPRVAHCLVRIAKRSSPKLTFSNRAGSRSHQVRRQHFELRLKAREAVSAMVVLGKVWCNENLHRPGRLPHSHQSAASGPRCAELLFIRALVPRPLPNSSRWKEEVGLAEGTEGSGLVAVTFPFSHVGPTLTIPAQIITSHNFIVSEEITVVTSHNGAFSYPERRVFVHYFRAFTLSRTALD